MLPFPHAPLLHPAPLTVGETIRLDGRAAAALRFRQINVSEAFTLGDSTGRWFRASLRACSDRGADARIYEEMASSPESPLDLTLVCAVLARQRMMVVVQKATELGVVKIVPVLTDHSVDAAGLEHEKAHAWSNQVGRACKQCRRGSVPLLEEPVPLTEALQAPLWQRTEGRWFLDDRIGEASPAARVGNSVLLAVGPEGGWSDREVVRLQEAQARPLRLGGRVLRAETAVLAGLVLVQHWWGDL